ncbi:hypothetical protein CQA53_11375 [Helicobacter didelphidarum]|uniref:Lipoprotein n=1 Tax=Helicobacter didelphidarum TaxID=2040648 RepID=A0A3D8I366_9HELI|nr:hypothetical protein [Helicobacter didelphidarum]RDU59583.1 hypothetical protein CQA53_11375 [Helicobacter didelphidarum]
MRMIYLIFGILVVILVFSGCVSTRFFDPQYYKFKRLVEKESGLYIVDPELNNEMRQPSFKSSDKLSNGYYVDAEDIQAKERIDSRITASWIQAWYFIDSQGKKHIISYWRLFTYKEHGLWLDGDEGRGFHWDTERKCSLLDRSKKFVLKDGKVVEKFISNAKGDKWVKIEN